MDCPICGKEMENGRVEREGIGGYDEKYVFIPEKDISGKRIKRKIQERRVKVSINLSHDCTAWHCQECKKLLMMINENRSD